MANLRPYGPVPWMTPVPAEGAGSAPGIYMVARVNEAMMGCVEAPLKFIDPLPPGLVVDLDYERQRWLPREPVLYIGKTDRPIRDRVREFYNHKCGDPSKHAGGQVLKLLQCDLWVYWSPTTAPLGSEAKAISAFKERAGQEPFGNHETKGRPKRVRRSN